MTLQTQDCIDKLSIQLRGFLEYMNITELDNGFYLGRKQERLVEMIVDYLNEETDHAFGAYLEEIE